MAVAAPSLFVIAMIFALVIAPCGLVFMFIGLRGRRIDDHPRCRGCGYDLSGHTRTPAACPECGRNLATKGQRAIRIGHRRKRPVLAAIGMVLVLVSIVAFSAIAWVRTNQLNIIEYYPVWLLHIELGAEDFSSSERALLELLRRQGAGALAKNDVVSTVDLLLPRHASLSDSWTDDYSRFVEQAWRDGDISDERMTGYVRAAIEQSLVVDSRPHVRTGGALPIRLVSGNKRLSKEFDRVALNTPGADVFVVRQRIGEVRKGDQVIRDLSGSTSTRSVSESFSALTTSVPIELNPGEHTLQVTALLELYIAPSDDKFRGEDSGDEVESWEVTVDLPITVLGEDQHFIELIPDDDSAMASQIRDAVIINLTDASVQVSREYTTSYEAGQGFVDVHEPPVNVAFTVYGRLDGVETELGSVARQAGEQAGSGWLFNRVADIYPDVEAIDIILRPDRAIAERTMDINRIWAGELVFENVPLRSSGEREHTESGDDEQSG